jgi:hypothetical protein
MSGQPLRKPTDAEHFRQDYLDTLNLQARIDDMNLQANKTYTETGQLPAISQMKDTRTTAEVLADREHLKLGLRKDLQKIGSPQFLDALIQAMEASPFNTDGSFFIFIAQRAVEIADTLSKQYKYGIKGDKNDIRTFLSFMEDLYTKTKGLRGSVKTYFDRPTVDRNMSLLSPSNVSTLREHFRRMVELLKRYTSTIPRGETDRDLVRLEGRISDYADILSKMSYVFEPSIFEHVRKFIAFSDSIVISAGERDLYNRVLLDYTKFMEFLEELPSASRINYFLEQFQKATKNKDISLQEQVFQQIESELGSLEDMEEFIDLVGNLVAGIEQLFPPETKRELEQQYRTFGGIEVDPTRVSGSGISGCGVSRSVRTRQSVIKNSDLDRGVQPVPRYVKFGKYLINQNKLNNDNVVTLRHVTGSSISGSKAQRVSKQLTAVIKKMIGGEIPTYSDLSGLSEPEKVYLHKLAKTSDILDKFDIPAPSKDKREKDIHDFEVMKGEIMAGNDNKDLIKAFKLHIMRLGREGVLPRSEVQEVIEDLFHLGY